MKDLLLKAEDFFIECELEGLTMIYTFSDDSRHHNVVTLRDSSSYEELKREINEIYLDCRHETDALCVVCDFLQTKECYDKYFKGESYIYHDIREREEIGDYLREATDKVWLMRSRKVDNPPLEARRQGQVDYLFEKYPDIPTDRRGRINYTDWECGYWNGIMSALRWVLGDEKDFLDT